MAGKFKNGDLVSQVLPAPVTGTVVGFSLDQTNGDVHIKVESTDGDGNVLTRDFLESDLELVPA